MGKIFYKIFDIEEETVVWKCIDDCKFQSDYECVIIDMYNSHEDMDVNDLLCDHTYKENLMRSCGTDVKSRLDELIRIDKIRKLLK